MLAKAGYGVLLYDARGRGESAGHENAAGWQWDRDVRGAVSFLTSARHRPHRPAWSVHRRRSGRHRGCVRQARRSGRCGRPTGPHRRRRQPPPFRRSNLDRAQLRPRRHRDPARTRRNATETIDRCRARGSADATAAANRHHRFRARNRSRLHARHKGAALGTADKCTHEGPSRPPDHVRAARPVGVQPGALEQSQREVAALLRPPLRREGDRLLPTRDDG